jgi:hypothetical protein
MAYKKINKVWKIGDKHPHYCRVAMMRTIEGEPYRFFIDKSGCVSMIPLGTLISEN